MSEVRVVVADDQPVVRDGLRAILAVEPDLTVVATVASGEEAVDAVARLGADVLLTDLRMPGIGGVEATRRVCAGPGLTRVVALTTYDDPPTMLAAVQAGAIGFLRKDAATATIADAVRAAAAGRSLLDAGVVSALLSGDSPRGREAPADPSVTPLGPGEPVAPSAAGAPGVTDRPDGLTEREVDVLRAIAGGASNQQITRTLFVSMSTVKTHVNHLLAKTGCRSRAELVSYAYRVGLTD